MCFIFIAMNHSTLLGSSVLNYVVKTGILVIFFKNLIKFSILLFLLYSITSSDFLIFAFVVSK